MRSMPEMDGFAVAERHRVPAGARRRADHDADLVGGIPRGVALRDARHRDVPDQADLRRPTCSPPSSASCTRGTAPIAAPPAVTARRRDTALAKPVGAPSVRVLLVEDNVVNQRVAAGLLIRRGHHVDGRTGRRRSARRSLETAAFDVVLMDLQMPVMSGLRRHGAIRAARGARRGPHVRIVP